METGRWLCVVDNYTSYRPVEPREGEPRPPNKAYQGLLGLGAIGPYSGLLGRLGSSCLGSNGLFRAAALAAVKTQKGPANCRSQSASAYQDRFYCFGRCSDEASAPRVSVINHETANEPDKASLSMTCLSPR